MAGLEDIVDNEDFYSLLNTPKDASQDQLRSSYRRLCMQYHPDKHSEENRREAAEIFNKVQYAYDVLSDPNKRYIYDIYGKKGLEADWQIVERRKTPQEIQEEYERLQRRKQLQKLEESTHPTSAFSMTVDATSLFDNPNELEDEFYDTVAMPEITKLSLSQSVEAPLSTSHTATLYGNIQTKNGQGQGDLSVSLRQTMSPKMWGELSLGASDQKHISLGLQGYRNITHGLFATVRVGTNALARNDVYAIEMPGLTSVAGYKLSDSLLGTIEHTTGRANKLCTCLMYEKKAIAIFGKLQLGVPNSFILLRLTYRFLSDKARAKTSIKLSTAGFLVEYGAEHQVSQFSTIGATVGVGMPMGVVLKIRLNRASQSYFMPILLSDELNPVAVFYATAVPAAIYFVLQKLVIQPYLRRKKQEEEDIEESNRSEETAHRKADAERQIRLMQESVERRLAAETFKHGLIITEAWYGKLVASTDQQAISPRVIDVKIPLQNLVENSSIQLPHDVSKSGLPGFYDPCPGSAKFLKVSYKFRNRKHRVFVADKDKLRIPLKSHLLDA